MKNKKILNITTLVVCILVVVGMGIAVLANVLGLGSKDKCTLYWNIDKATYLTDSGLSSREPQGDGYYHVLLAVDGEQVEYKVSDKGLVDAIDNYDLMGLEIDKKGIITEVLDPEEVTGGELISKWYVSEVSEDKFTVTDDLTKNKMKYDIEINQDTGVYDVTGKEPVGHSTEVEVGDCVRVFRDYEKEVIYVFVVNPDDAFWGSCFTAYCEHCEKEVEWYEWEETSTLPTAGGHWCLKNDVNLTIMQKISTDEEVVLDLNGKTVSGHRNRRMYFVGAGVTASTLSILDQSAEGTGVMKANGYVQNGGIIHVKAGCINLYSGTLDASNVDTEYLGTAVYLYNDASGNMYGGTIIGGTTRCASRAGETSQTGGGGGSMYMCNRSTFTMYDGTIRDGKVYAWDKGTSYGWGNGGNIHVRSDATLIMEGGQIIDGFAEKYGANVYLTTDNAKLIMRGGVISGGVTGQIKGANGANVYVSKGCELELIDGEIKDGRAWEGGGGNVMIDAGTLTMSGGRITGGLSVTGESLDDYVVRDVYHHNIYCRNGNLEMSGGYISGNVTIASWNTENKDGTVNKSTVKLSGTAQIKDGVRNLEIPTGFLLEVGELEKGSYIGVYGKGFISEKTAKSNLSYVHSDFEGVDVSYYNKQLLVGKMSCICGGSHVDSSGTLVKEHYGECDGTILEWWPWTSDKTAPSQEGNWYLTKDVTLEKPQGIAKEAKIALDLNGFTLKSAENQRVYNLGSDKRNIQMSITDLSESGTGKIVCVSTEEIPHAGDFVVVTASNKVTLYKGVLDASKVKSRMGGTLLAVRKDGSFTMYGGTMIGGLSLRKTDDAGKQSEGTAGTVLVEGEFKLYDGIIKDGRAEYYAGNVHVKNGKMFIYGGRIENGEGFRGGNIMNQGEIHMSGGLVTGGTAEQGGNIAGLNGCTFNLAGGTIENGEALVLGGNVSIPGNFTMTGGTIKNGVVTLEASKCNATNGIGGNVYVTGWKTTKDETTTIHRGNFTMSGGTISGGTAINGRGGNVFVASNADMVLSDKAVIENGISLAGGGNVFLNESTLTVNGGHIKDGKDSSSGGNVRVAYMSKLNMSGGKITGGQVENAEKNTYGGNISDVATATMNFTGGHVSDGSILRGAGGNIYAIGTVLISNDAIIEAGDAGSGTGGNVSLGANTAILTMNGGTIKNGSASTGYNVTVANDALLIINAGTIEGGNQNGTVVNGSIRVATSGSDIVLGSGVIHVSGPDGGLYLDKDRSIEVSDVLNKNTKIQIRVNTDRVFMKDAKETYVKNFVADQEGKGVFFDDKDKTLYIGKRVLTSEELASGVVFDLKNVSAGTIIAENAIPLADRDKFTAINDEGKKLMFSEDGIQVVAANAHVHCLCGDTLLTEGPCATAGHYEVEYTAMTSTTSLAKSGNYYLSDDLDYQQSARQIPVTNAKINVCLNGHNFNLTDDQRLLQIGNAGVEVSFTGKCGYSSENTDGSIVGVTAQTTDYTYTPGLFFMNTGSLNLYNLTLNVKDWEMGGRAAGAGAGITMYNGAKLYTYGSTIIPADTIETANYKTANKANRGVYAYGDYTWTNPEGLTGTVANGEVHDVTGKAVGTKLSDVAIPLAIRAYHTTNDATKKLMFKSDGIYVVSADAHVHCACGDSSLTTGPCATAGHFEVEYAEMTSTTSLANDGNYYLSGDLEYTAGRQRPANKELINVCLNGHNLKITDDERFMHLDSSANIDVTFTGKCNYSTGDNNGSIVGKTTASPDVTTGFFFINKGALNFYNLTLNVKDWEMGARAPGAGAGIIMYGSAKLYTCGSTIVCADTIGTANYKTADKANRGVYAYETGYTWTNPEGLTGTVANGEVHDVTGKAVGTKLSDVAIPLAIRAYHTTNDATKKLMFKSDGIYVVSADAHVHCACGDSSLTTGPCATAGHFEVEYAEMTSTTSLANDGNYYLSSDLAYTAGTQRPENKNLINVCLNGHNLKFTDEKRFLHLDKSANINVTFNGKCKFSAGNNSGSIIGNTTKAQATTTGFFFINQGSLNFYNLTLNVKGWEMGAREAGAGAGITMYGTAKLYTYGSTIIPADTFGLVKDANKATANRGVYAYGNYTWTNQAGLVGNPANGQ